MERIVTGVLFKEADKPNINGMVWTKEALEDVHNQIKERVKDNKFVGEFGKVSDPNVNLSNAGFIVKDSNFEDGALSIDVEVLDKPDAETMVQMIQDGKLVPVDVYEAP